MSNRLPGHAVASGMRAKEASFILCPFLPAGRQGPRLFPLAGRSTFRPRWVLIRSTLNAGLMKPRRGLTLVAGKEKWAGKIERFGSSYRPAVTALTIDSISYMVISNDSSPTARIFDACNPCPSAFTFVGGKVGRRNSFRIRGVI